MIKNEYTVTWKLYRGWLFENKLTGVRLAFLLFWSLMAVVTLVIGFFANIPLFFLFLSLYCVYRAVLRDYIAGKKQYSQLANLCDGKNWIRTITISDTEISISEGPSLLSFQNTDVVRVVEKGDKIWLFVNNDAVIRMYKSAFVEGSWEKCPMSFH